MKVTVDVKNAQAKEETRGSDMVAEGVMEVHTAHATCCGITLSRTREITGICWEFGFHVLAHLLWEVRRRLNKSSRGRESMGIPRRFPSLK